MIRYRSKLAERITHFTDIAFSALIFLTVIALLGFSALKVGTLFVDIVEHTTSVNIIHNVVYIVVLLKAYKILVYYLQSHNLSIKYLMQISIIAPAIEVIFASDAQPLSISILFAVYSLANLVIYLIYYRTLQNIQEE